MDNNKITDFGKLWVNRKHKDLYNFFEKNHEISTYQDPYGNTILHKVIANEPFYEYITFSHFMATKYINVFKNCLNLKNSNHLSGLDELLLFNKIAFSKDLGSELRTIGLNEYSKIFKHLDIEIKANASWFEFFKINKKLEGNNEKFDNLFILFLKKLIDTTDDKFKNLVFIDTILSNPSQRIINYLNNFEIKNVKLSSEKIKEVSTYYNEAYYLLIEKNIINTSIMDDFGNNLLHLSALNANDKTYGLINFLVDNLNFDLLQKNNFGYDIKDILDYGKKTIKNEEDKVILQQVIEKIQSKQECALIQKQEKNIKTYKKNII